MVENSTFPFPMQGKYKKARAGFVYLLFMEACAKVYTHWTSEHAADECR